MDGLNPRGLEAQVIRLARCYPELLPPCLCSLEYFCGDCFIADKDSCAFIMNEDFLSLLRWKVSNISRIDQDTNPDELIVNILGVFESQGSALHVDKILNLLKRQDSDLKVNLTQVKNVLKGNPDFFKETDNNVFTLNSESSDSVGP